MRRQQHYFQQYPGDPAPITVTIQRRLRFSEVDALGIAWHGRYLQFFEDAHTELMHKTGLTYDHYFKHDVAAPIVQAHVDYFAPLLLDEQFAVKATFFWCEGARLNVEYSVTKPNGELAATGFTVQMFYDIKTRKPCLLIPDIFQECLEQWKKGAFYD
ncbi:MAG TPA: thioesterase family protein [Lentisphaeria bacterium]|nr:acyl-CoA thioesterase [Lentisphaerota bacterium]OQC17019.1 MAG: 1,4-dihydroxy-2-naphthoyl-CoA hydrolase [Lentisphaerae bacterium ADurb.Bin082]HPY90227.1 thioesterase family protein [Lentisphaeria bacterium]HQC53987.1 thioesterase family protein [Lentisphaeria bacterium]HQL86074.1 thioesterase family protein [Lentisphaeria bacterium]